MSNFVPSVCIAALKDWSLGSEPLSKNCAMRSLSGVAGFESTWSTYAESGLSKNDKNNYSYKLASVVSMNFEVSEPGFCTSSTWNSTFGFFCGNLDITFAYCSIKKTISYLVHWFPSQNQFTSAFAMQGLAPGVASCGITSATFSLNSGVCFSKAER